MGPRPAALLVTAIKRAARIAVRIYLAPVKAGFFFLIAEDFKADEAALNFSSAILSPGLRSG